MSLLNLKIVQGALAAFARRPTGQEIEAAHNWAARANDPGIALQSESQLEQEFNRTIVQGVLGYIAPGPGEAGTMRVKQPIPGGTIVDVALGHFDDDEARILAPFELKGPKAALDRIMPGRSKTPVQQAWDYAMDTPGARWVLLSNMREIRLYAFGHGRLDYERFDLARLHDEAELRRFQMLLHVDQLLSGATENLLARSAEADRTITDQLYRDYKDLRGRLMQFVADQRPAIPPDRRIRTVQTLLDRLLFIAFAEDTFLLPEKSLHEAISVTNKFSPLPKWHQLRKLFQWVDEGATEHNIPPYNGGLFAADPDIDGLDLPDHLVESFAFLGAYDFRSDVSVSILGHIFEQSISDIEGMHAEARQLAPPAAGKKKREGVVYTPDFVTRFIVEQTVGRHLADIRAALIPSFGKADAEGEIKWKRKSSERDFWQAYLDRLTTLRVLDPACGSGAFLIAAFDHLHDEQKRVRARLGELDPGLLVHAAEHADVEIITNNLFGVDVNAESVEITKLALWLKTAKRERKLESLDANIKWGNSLVDSAAVHPHPFDWAGEFPAILNGKPSQGFDIVIGNPPYVRMELLKEIKPHLQARYAVASDRADLYAYFFELAVRVLKPGGRLGFISSSTFFRTGSGAALRALLSADTQIEAVVDFGDLQVFEGVTTYPAIVTLRKGDATPGDPADSKELSYLNVRAMPDDLSKTFESQALPMPRSRLTSATWRFESDLLDAIREKMAKGRLTLSDVYDAPLRGIVTGLNDAFILSREQRDALVERAERYGDDSAELLKPFLMGENLKRWHVESDDLWLIYTPKNITNIDDYPALRDHLAPYRQRLEARATKQKWWELQQAQAAYEPSFNAAKIIYPHFNDKPNFSFDPDRYYSNDKSYVIPSASSALAGFLNSKLSWFQLCGLAPAVRGGFREARVQYVGALAVFNASIIEHELGAAAEIATTNSAGLHILKRAVLHRLGDITPQASRIAALADWPALTFAELQSILLKRARVNIPVQQRDEWERWFEGNKAEAEALAGRVTSAEAEINDRVYRLFGLTPTEVNAVEDALATASPALSLKAYEAVSAVEGLALSPEGRDRLARHDPAKQSRVSAA